MAASAVYNIAIDCADAFNLASFWSKVTGNPVDREDSPGDPVVNVQLAPELNLYFAQVPEPKVGKNRVHLCLRPDHQRDDEVERILGLGATIFADRRNPDGTGWVVFADPEGNEFCLLRSAAERAATGH